MPNWCEQYGEVRGDNAELKKFVDAIRVEQDAEWLALKEYQRPYWDMNQLFPIPQELRDTISGRYGADNGNKKPEQIALEKQQESNIAKYGYKNWHDWANDNWDTKWGARDVSVVDSNIDEYTTSIRVNWISAWGPATGLVKNISMQFPELVFGFYMTEEADFFAGFMVIHNGDIVSEYEDNLTGQPEPSDDDDDYYEKYSQWKDKLCFDLEDGLDTAISSYQISQS